MLPLQCELKKATSSLTVTFQQELNKTHLLQFHWTLIMLISHQDLLSSFTTYCCSLYIL